VFQNAGIWKVVMAASASASRANESAVKKEAEFQALTKNYQELQTRVGGGRFVEEDARVGSKRAAPTEDPARGGGKSDSSIWDQFGAHMKSQYSADSFIPMAPRPNQ
jgi:hypothetical protein